MDRVHSLQLDFMYTEKLITDVSFKQYDYGTSYLDISLTFNGEPCSINNEVIVAVFKNSKNNFILDENNSPVRSFGYITNVGEGRVLIQIPDEILKVKGNCTCEIISFLPDGRARRTTQAFVFQIVSSITELENIDVPEEILTIVGMFKCGGANVGFTKKRSEKSEINSSELYYERTFWEDGITPVNAENLNKIETAIEQMVFSMSNIPSDSIIYKTEADTSINTIKDALDKLLYTSLNISFNTPTTIFEIGTIINSITFTWSYNKSIIWQKFNNELLEVSLRKYIYNIPFSSKKSFTIIANDGKKEYNRSIEISFLNGIYWGVSSSTVYDNNFIKTLTKQLSDNRKRTITVDCNEGQYIYYCLPTRLGTPSFSVGGFSGGFDKVSTILFENNSGFTENYDIWKSTNSNLGKTTILVE